MPLSDWHQFDYELKYRLGELTLGTQALRVMRKVFPLAEIIARENVRDLPALGSGFHGYLLANVPSECESGSITPTNGLLRYCIKSYQRCYIDMIGTFEGYQQKFSAKTRSGIKRKVRKFSEQAGGLDFRVFSTPESMSDFFSLARPVSAVSYQERLLDCGLPAEESFFDKACDAAARDQVRAFVLCAHGEPVSYLFCPIEDGVLAYAYLGYTPDSASLSPGTVLQWLALQSLFAEEKFTAFDFTEGESEHKLFFSTHQIPCSMQLLLKPSAYTQVSARLHRGIDRLSASAGTLLERYGLKSRLKKLIRRTASQG